jgi:HB1, ASXL, restriction endonuclease HTH domain
MNTDAKPKTAKQAAAEVLRAEGGPLTMDELAERILKSGNVKLSGKTPKATISGQLYVEARKPDGMFELVRRATFRLREQT